MHVCVQQVFPFVVRVDASGSVDDFVVMRSGTVCSHFLLDSSSVGWLTGRWRNRLFQNGFFVQQVKNARIKTSRRGFLVSLILYSFFIFYFLILTLRVRNSAREEVSKLFLNAPLVSCTHPLIRLLRIPAINLTTGPATVTCVHARSPLSHVPVPLILDTQKLHAPVAHQTRSKGCQWPDVRAVHNQIRGNQIWGLRVTTSKGCR